MFNCGVVLTCTADGKPLWSICQMNADVPPKADASGPPIRIIGPYAFGSNVVFGNTVEEVEELVKKVLPREINLKDPKTWFPGNPEWIEEYLNS